jgi:ribosomal protein S18 acetylase RimI-like enzyme
MNAPPAARVSIRRATAGDAPAILACLAAAFEPFRDRYSREGYEDTTLTAQTIGARMRTMDVFVAESDGTVVGTIAAGVASPQEGHLRGMAVLPEWQGRGLAGQLLAVAEAHLRDRGCTRITLDTTEPLQRAIRFYEKHGYRATGKIGDHFGMPLYEYAKSVET